MTSEYKGGNHPRQWENSSRGTGVTQLSAHTEMEIAAVPTGHTRTFESKFKLFTGIQNYLLFNQVNFTMSGIQ